jgi:hypothetical protein
MRAWSDAERDRLMAMYRMRARYRRIVYADVQAIAFKLRRPAREVLTEILRLQADGELTGSHRLGLRGRSPQPRRAYPQLRGEGIGAFKFVRSGPEAR